MAQYKGILIMNDGRRTGTFLESSIEAVKESLKNTLNLKTRYFKRNGVDYGEKGKLFTFEEDHEGIKQVQIFEVVSKPILDITKEFKKRK